MGLKQTPSQLIKTLSERIGDGLIAPKADKVRENIIAGNYGVINIQTDEDLLKFYNLVKSFKNLDTSIKDKLLNEWMNADQEKKIIIKESILDDGDNILRIFRLTPADPSAIVASFANANPNANPNPNANAPAAGGRRSRKSRKSSKSSKSSKKSRKSRKTRKTRKSKTQRKQSKRS